MKTILSTLIFLCLATSTWAQSGVKSINVDNLRFSFQERMMPKKPFNPPFFYYSCQVMLHPSLKGNIGERELADRVGIVDQRKARSERDANMLVKVTMMPIEIIDYKVVRRVERRKDKYGEITHISFYSTEITYSFAASADIINWKTKTSVYGYDIQNRKEVRVFTTREFDEMRAAELYWGNNRALVMEEIVRGEAMQAIDRLNIMLEKDYSFLIHKNSGLIKTINEKKHPENQALRRKSNSLAATLTRLNGTVALRQEKIQSELDYFMRIPQRYTSDSKPDIRLRYVAYYNICRIYLFLEQPEEVERWANLLYENGFDIKDRDRLVKDAQDMRQTLDNGVGTMQFDPQNYFEQ